MNWDEFASERRRMGRKTAIFIGICAAVALILVITAPALGSYDTTIDDVLDVIWGHITGSYDAEDRTDYVIWEVRMSVTVMAVIVGFVLGICGSMMQAIMRNPLADPYTMGISSGASLGAILAISLGLSLIPGLTGNFMIVANAFILSLVPTAVILAIVIFRRISNTSMILCGIGVMYFFSAFSSLLMLYADPTKMSVIYEWNLGNLGTGHWDHIPVMFAVCVAGSAILYMLANSVDITLSGDDPSKTLGVNPTLMRVTAMVTVSLTVASIVSFTGTIGFIGLVAPHIARLFVGSRQRILLPASGLVGAIMLLVAADIVRVIGGLPVGAITTIIGCPIFILLLIKNRNANWF